MAKFIGKWKGDYTKAKNYDGFAQASGMTPDMIERFRSAVFEIEFRKLDDRDWEVDYKNHGDPSMNKVYKFQSGVENTSGKDLAGGALKYTITIESDSKMIETEASESSGWTVNSGGNEMSYTMTRVKC